jgi:hypothetical protein
MNFKNVLDQLREERDTLDEAISNLERLERGRNRGPGRPPSFLTKGHTNNGNHNHTPPDPEPGDSAA